ncbi:MAG TPA: L-threonylcarbamoyladenylate synthase [Desulfomonilia bacterium]|nr:L-threonylcarbamoyladenylate synthase [Desulfomonilia bacterium]
MIVTKDASAIAFLLSGQPGSLAAYPTETFYGLGARIADHAALERLLRIKGRDASKGMIVLVSDLKMAGTIARISSRLNALLEKFWPGPISVLLYAREDVEPLVVTQGKIGLRISPNSLAASLVELAGPITSTSANRSGEPSARTADEVMKQGLDIDAVLDGGETPGGRPSTLIDLTAWPPVCVRRGAVPFEDILGFCS